MRGGCVCSVGGLKALNKHNAPGGEPYRQYLSHQTPSNSPHSPLRLRFNFLPSHATPQDRTPPRLLRDAGLALGYLQTQIVYLLVYRFQLLPEIESHVSEPQQDAIRTCAGCSHLNACLTHDTGFKFWEVRALARILRFLGRGGGSR